MRERADRNEVHTLLGVRTNRLYRNTSGGLNLHMTSRRFLPSADDIYRLFGFLRREIIEHDTVRYVCRKCLFDLIEITALDLNPQVLALLLTKIACPR